MNFDENDNTNNKPINDSKTESKQDSFLQEFGDFNQQSNFGQKSFTGGLDKTNAITDLFGGIDHQKQEQKKKMIMGGVAVAVIVACLLYVFLTLQDDGSQVVQTPDLNQNLKTAEAPATPTKESEVSEEAETPEASAQSAPPEPRSEPSSSSPTVTASSPESYKVDMHQTRGPVIQVSPNTEVVVAFDPDLKDVFWIGVSKTEELRLPPVLIGTTLYWSAGDKTVHTIRVEPADSLNLKVSYQGGALTWSSSGGPVGYYHVEVASDPQFRQIVTSAKTTQTTLSLSASSGSPYYVRLKALNLVSGQIEVTESSITP